jgi:hypothetical protein
VDSIAIGLNKLFHFVNLMLRMKFLDHLVVACYKASSFLQGAISEIFGRILITTIKIVNIIPRGVSDE